MSFADLREAFRLVLQRPVLWIPGAVFGVLMAGTWLFFAMESAPFTGKLLLFAGVLSFPLLGGAYVSVKEGGGDPAIFARGVAKYYFRVLLPALVIAFGIGIITVIASITLAFAGIPGGMGVVMYLMNGIALPILFFTIYADTAAVFEDKGVFDSIRRSTDMVLTRLGETIKFIAISIMGTIGLSFVLYLGWVAALYPQLKPLLDKYEKMQMNGTPLQPLTRDLVVPLLGSDGIWITAVFVFAGSAILMTLVATYKACLYRRLGESGVPVYGTKSGEYDSKGRWYKY
jgi:hypothetical protein